MKTFLTALIFIFVLLVAIAVGSQNEQVVDVNYLLAVTSLPLSTVIAICIGIGILLSLILLLGYILKLKWQIVRLQKRIKQLNQP
ncbi:lipopolysaccharide assembly protein LapA domain-containing protein [Neptunicella marina]|uniref:DUF1049 domain-containing protein n=1 Tax=Neptunicella marina TaxID=2125989 RepID=A0A8J6IQZ7_9ALTE|nr:lipopolysaccharide assembly protein LapA domain-containing protein [Neptunicella marina]MBC3764247.1 DUF1049 domain-containing protein [Neptunicella marina]